MGERRQKHRAGRLVVQARAEVGGLQLHVLRAGADRRARGRRGAKGGPLLRAVVGAGLGGVRHGGHSGGGFSWRPEAET